MGLVDTPCVECGTPIPGASCQVCDVILQARYIEEQADYVRRMYKAEQKRKRGNASMIRALEQAEDSMLSDANNLRDVAATIKKGFIAEYGK